MNSSCRNGQFEGYPFSPSKCSEGDRGQTITTNWHVLAGDYPPCQVAKHNVHYCRPYLGRISYNHLKEREGISEVCHILLDNHTNTHHLDAASCHFQLFLTLWPSSATDHNGLQMRNGGVRSTSQFLFNRTVSERPLVFWTFDLNAIHDESRFVLCLSCFEAKHIVAPLTTKSRLQRSDAMQARHRLNTCICKHSTKPMDLSRYSFFHASSVVELPRLSFVSATRFPRF